MCIMETFINDDINEQEAWLLSSCDTLWIYGIQEREEENSLKYLRNKFNTNNLWLDKYCDIWVWYLNNLNEEKILKLFHFSKKLYNKNFWEKYWCIAFSNFAWGLVQDKELYSKIINNSKKINNFLFSEFNNSFKHYPKNHKYRIWIYISLVMKNLGISIKKPENLNMYDFWEKYNPKSENFNVK